VINHQFTNINNKSREFIICVSLENVGLFVNVVGDFECKQVKQ